MPPAKRCPVAAPPCDTTESVRPLVNRLMFYECFKLFRPESHRNICAITFPKSRRLVPAMCLPLLRSFRRAGTAELKGRQDFIKFRLDPVVGVRQRGPVQDVNLFVL